MNPKPSTEPEFKFLAETPNLKETTLKFGHPQVITSLKKIIQGCRSSMTIGLFGNWGSGKSSIVENLKIKLQEEQTPVIIFDVWKHDGDALRRTFLLDLDRQLSTEPYGKNYVKALNILNSRVYNSSTNSTEIYSVKWKKLLKYIGLLSLFALPVVLLMALLFSLIYHLTGIQLSFLNDHPIGSVIAILLSAVSGGVLFKFLDNFIKTEKKEVKEERLQDPHEFETEFRNLVENLKNETSSLVIVFDNLDRVSGENAVQVISTIKTFLDYRQIDNKKRVIFLIPCDVLAIRKHISKIFNTKDNEDADEFLRKFFNTTLYIPAFYETELETFATEKLKETDIDDFGNPYLSWLIIKVFDKNPRQVIQFINILITNYLLLKQFCEEHHFHNPLFYQENVPQLARFLLLKQRFPAIMDSYLANRVYTLDHNDFLNSLPENLPLENVEEFRNLLSETRMIQIASLEPFFKFRLSKAEQDLPGINQLLEQITKGRTAIKKLDIAAIENKVSAFSDALRIHFNGISNRISKLDFLNNILEFTAQTKVSLSNILYRELFNFTMKNLREDFIQVSPSLLREQLLTRINPLQTIELHKVTGFYLAAANHATNQGTAVSEPTLLDIMDMIIFDETALPADQMIVVRYLLQYHYKNRIFLFKVLDHEKFQELFIDEQLENNLIQKLIETVDENEIHYLLLVTSKLITKENSAINLANAVTKQFPVMMKFKATASPGPMELITAIIKKLVDAGFDLKEQIETIVEQISGLNDLSDYAGIIVLYYHYGTPDSQLRQQFFDNLLASAKPGLLRKLFEEIPDIMGEIGRRSINEFLQRGKSEPGINELFIEFFTNAQFVDYLALLLQQNATELLQTNLLEQTDNYSNQDIDTITGRLLQAAQSDQSKNKVTWTVQLLSELYSQVSYTPEIYLDFLIRLASGDPTKPQHQIVLDLISETIKVPNIGRRTFARQFASMAYANTFSAIPKIYQILFSLWDELEAEDRIKVRNLVYQHLLPATQNDKEFLETAILAIDQNYDLHGSEADIYNFLKSAKEADPAVLDYYARLAEMILYRLKTYDSEEFKTIKDQLKKFIKNPNDEEPENE